MNKFSATLLFLALFFTTGLSQVTDTEISQVADSELLIMAGRELNIAALDFLELKKFKNRSSDVYLYKEFQKGALITSKDYKYSALVNYDIKTERLLVKDGDNIIAINDGEVKYFETENNKFAYINTNSKKSSPSFFEVMTTNKIILLKKWSLQKKVDSSNPLVSASEISHTYTKKTSFYFYNPSTGIARKVPSNYRKFTSLFGNKKIVMEKFIRSYDLNFKKEVDLISIFNHFSKL